MIQRVNTPVTVKVVFDHHKRLPIPKIIQWEGKEYQVTKLGLHHTFRDGKTLFHVFSLTTKNLFFRLSLNTDNLLWTVEETSDGLAD